MRELKFRAWDKRNKRMYFSELGDLIWYLDKTTKLGAMPFAKQPYGEDFSEIMQFTGLKDKNGKEIWEGDIIFYEVVGHNKGHKAIIKFKDGSFVESYYGWRLYPEGQEFMMEIIGNIHENPELIDSKQPE